MWSRQELKERAKEILRLSYWKAFLVSLILMAVTGGGSGSSGSRYTTNKGEFDAVVGTVRDINFGFILMFIGFILFIALIAILIHVFIASVFEVGCRKYFVHSTKEEFSINHVMFGFKKDKYMNIVLTILLRNVFLFLWTCLLIIPGIIKFYAYRFVPYILAENPNISPTRAIQMSNEMTKGHKFEMFVLDLSFIGWYILGLLALGIGTLFVLPYHNQTFAQLYIVLRNDGIRQSITSYQELNINREDKSTSEEEWKSVFDRDDY